MGAASSYVDLHTDAGIVDTNGYVAIRTPRDIRRVRRLTFEESKRHGFCNLIPCQERENPNLVQYMKWDGSLCYLCADCLDWVYDKIMIVHGHLADRCSIVEEYIARALVAQGFGEITVTRREDRRLFASCDAWDGGMDNMTHFLSLYHDAVSAYWATVTEDKIGKFVAKQLKRKE